MISKLPIAQSEIDSFLDRDIKSVWIPDRNSIEDADGRWVRVTLDKQFGSWRYDGSVQ